MGREEQLRQAPFFLKRIGVGGSALGAEMEGYMSRGVVRMVKGVTVMLRIMLLSQSCNRNHGW